MELSVQDRNGVRLVSVAEARIDALVAIRFKDRMREVTAPAPGDAPPARVLLDLSRVEFIDSSGLGAIVAAMKQLDGASRLELAGLTPAVEKVFRLTRMDTIFTIHDSVEHALHERSA